ncbi:restriction endonuclease subunit S [Vibrio coralliilyticus]|nr:restriction endonuclease subunit S [Vibrio coralliilyticus]
MGEAATFINGDRGKNYPKHSDFMTSGIPFVNTGHITTQGWLDLDDMQYISREKFNELRSGKLAYGDIVYCLRGSTIGKIARVNVREGAIASSLVIIRAKEGICQDYLYHYFSSESGRGLVGKFDNGSAQPNLSVSAISQFPLLLPPFTEQEKISTFLNTLNNKITLNRQINQTLEQLAQTLFKSWFVDFDPVMDNALDAGNPIPDELQHRAEARKAVRESEGFKPLPYNVRQLFPDAFEESELGWVPKGWMVSTAGDEFTVKGGSTPSTKSAEFWEGGDIHWTSPKDLSGKAEKIMLDTDRRITAAGLSKITSGLLPPETVLMSSRAPVGYLAMTKIPVAINQGYIAITGSKSLTQEFTLYWIDSRIEMIKSISGGTTFAEISKKTFRTIPMVVPSAQSVNAFSETVALYLSKISKNIEECGSLCALRDSLLPKLMSGELEII